MADLYTAPARPSLVDDKNGPAIAVTKSRAARYFEDIRVFPGHDMSLDAISVTESGWRINEVGNHVHAFFLDSQRRNLRKCSGLNKPYPRMQNVITAPAVEKRCRTGLDTNRVGGQNVRYDFNLPSVPQHNDRRTGLHNPLALLDNSQHWPGH